MTDMDRWYGVTCLYFGGKTGWTTVSNQARSRSLYACWWKSSNQTGRKTGKKCQQTCNCIFYSEKSCLYWTGWSGEKEERKKEQKKKRTVIPAIGKTRESIMRAKETKPNQPPVSHPIPDMWRHINGPYQSSLWKISSFSVWTWWTTQVRATLSQLTTPRISLRSTDFKTRLQRKWSSYKLKAHFARHGERVVSDNGPPFQSSSSEGFVITWSFQHVTSSPKYPQSNVKAENAVKAAKTLIRKTTEESSSPYLVAKHTIRKHEQLTKPKVVQ